jgi:hypothetical protein
MIVTDTTDTHPLAYAAGREVFKAFGRYYYLSGVQVRDLLYDRQSDASRKYAIKWLTRLTRARLLVKANTYERVATPGSDPAVWSRTELGQRELDRLGIPNPVSVPAKKKISREVIEHLKIINDTLISLERFGRETPGITLLKQYHDLELKSAPIAGKVLDGYVGYFLDHHQLPVGIGLEVDRGTERRFPETTGAASWDDSIRRLVNLVGPHEEAFGIKLIRFAIVIQSIGKPNPDRLRDLVHWTEDALTRYADETWGPHFRFTIADPTTMSPAEFVTGNHWVTPFTYQHVPLVALQP